MGFLREWARTSRSARVIEVRMQRFRVGEFGWAEEYTKKRLADDLVKRIQFGQTYALTVTEAVCDDPIMDEKIIRMQYELIPATGREIEICMIVPIKNTRSFNCRNCGAPLEVGDIRGDRKLVVCCYCRTNHIVTV